MNDYAWNNASAIERCEILKSRLDQMEEATFDRVIREPGWSVSAAELARLRRIAEAARRVIEKWDFEELMEPLGTCRNRSPSLGALRTALDSEPGR